MSESQPELDVRALQVVLHGATSLPVFALHQVMLDGMILGVGGALHTGQTLRADLHHPLWRHPLIVQVRVGWCRPFGPQHFVAGIELVGTWEVLGVQRRCLAPVLGSVANGRDRPLGFVLRAPRELVCTDPYTQRLAVVLLGPEGFRVHRRDGLSLAASDLGEALRQAYDVAEAPWLSPPLPGLGAGGEPARAAPPEPALDEELLGMRTVVLAPDRGAPADAVFDSGTIVLSPDDEDTARVVRPAGADEDSRVLGADTVALHQGRPRDDACAVLDGQEVVGYVVSTGMEGSWSLYDTTGTKVAMLAAVEDCVRVCAMGRNAKDDLSFLEAATGAEALALALGLRGALRVDPPVPGL